MQDEDLERYFYTREIDGSPQKLARMRITSKGHGLLSTGTHDPVTLRQINFSEGEICEGPAENLAIYEERGIAVRVPPPTRESAAGGVERGTRESFSSPACGGGGPTRSVGTEGGPPSPQDRDAIARLAARSLRDEKTGCLVWQGSRANGGYGQITYQRRHFTTHRLSWIAHRGEIPPNRYVCHACDNPGCVAIEHLFLGTPSENYRDMRKKRRVRYNAKLTIEDVAKIRERLATGEAATAIAKDFTVNAEQILKIKSGLAWRDIEPPSP